MHDMNFARQPVTIMTAVNFCELKISQNPAETLVAFSIGSGIVVSIYDPVMKAGGMLGFVLPDSLTMTPEKADELVKNGATLLDTPAKVGETSDILITMLSTPSVIEEAALGADGFLPARARAGDTVRLAPGEYRVNLVMPLQGRWDLVLQIRREDDLHEVRASTSVRPGTNGSGQ